MCTPCYIAKQIGDDKYRTIYCQFDGYLEHVGAILLDAYNTPEKLDELLSLGDISALGLRLSSESGKPYSEGHYPKDTTIAYARDMGEKMVEAQDMTLDELYDCDCGVEFVYIFDRNNVWKYFNIFDSYGDPRSVKETLEAAFPNAIANATEGYYKAIIRNICQQDQASPNLSM